MLGATLQRLGCYGVLVWLLIGGLIAIVYVGEYLDRPEEEKSFWKAGVTVSRILVVFQKNSKSSF